MSASPDDWSDVYRQWLSQGRGSRPVYETLQISHPYWTGALYLVNNENNMTLPVDGGGNVTFTAARFLMEPSETSDTTEQSMTVTMSALSPSVYQQVKDMPIDQRSNPMTVIPRLYLNDQQVIDPPPVWNVHALTVTIDAVKADLRADPLRVQRIGRYYTTLEFPVLELIT